MPRGGQASDDMTMRGVLEADDSTRGGGGRREASERRMTGRHSKRVGAHDVVGGGDGGGDIGDGSWSSEIGGAPSSMPGTAAPATVPAPGGFDDADDTPMAVGGGRGGGER